MAGLMGKSFWDSAVEDAKGLKEWEKEKETTPGYVLEQLDKETVIVKLLETGKCADKYGGCDDIRMETIRKALLELNEKGCEIKDTTAITESSGWGSATTGLIVKINCK